MFNLIECIGLLQRLRHRDWALHGQRVHPQLRALRVSHRVPAVPLEGVQSLPDLPSDPGGKRACRRVVERHAVHGDVGAVVAGPGGAAGGQHAADGGGAEGKAKQRVAAAEIRMNKLAERSSFSLTSSERRQTKTNALHIHNSRKNAQGRIEAALFSQTTFEELDRKNGVNQTKVVYLVQRDMWGGSFGLYF